ncbi:MAG TPA: patatin-like phospholipase family protein [Anaeromyxobacteraceae bacterium]|nr:patatin-like phospholipase family protein [Anaeromyxobacteraceae bacterium]
MHVGLVLTGGGARAAYQAGALRALAQILPAGALPFRILCGISAGGVNACFLGGNAADFRGAADGLADLWLGLTPDQVYRTDTARMLAIGTRWARDLSAGGLFRRSKINFLLDATPLRDLLHENLPLLRLRQNLSSGVLSGFAVTATSYASSVAVTFFDGAPSIEPWVRATRVGVRESIRLDHVMASAAIPIFFPPVRIKGAWYGDGSVRMTAPLSPAVHMGAERLVVVGVRRWRNPEELVPGLRPPRKESLAPSEIAGTLLNAAFLESIEADVERLERINQLVEMVPPGERGKLPHDMRFIPALVLRPSRDLGELAGDQHKRFPRFLRYLLSGLGANGGNASDLLSYLAFEPVYVKRLVELGYEDTLSRRREVELFFAEGTPSRDRPRAGLERRPASR